MNSYSIHEQVSLLRIVIGPARVWCDVLGHKPPNLHSPLAPLTVTRLCWLTLAPAPTLPLASCGREWHGAQVTSTQVYIGARPGKAVGPWWQAGAEEGAGTLDTTTTIPQLLGHNISNITKKQLKHYTPLLKHKQTIHSAAKLDGWKVEGSQ